MTNKNKDLEINIDKDSGREKIKKNNKKSQCIPSDKVEGFWDDNPCETFHYQDGSQYSIEFTYHEMSDDNFPLNSLNYFYKSIDCNCGNYRIDWESFNQFIYLLQRNLKKGISKEFNESFINSKSSYLNYIEHLEKKHCSEINKMRSIIFNKDNEINAYKKTCEDLQRDNETLKMLDVSRSELIKKGAFFNDNKFDWMESPGNLFIELFNGKNFLKIERSLFLIIVITFSLGWFWKLSVKTLMNFKYVNPEEVF